MALFKKNKNINQPETVSDENTAMLPDNKQSKSSIMTKRTNRLLVFIGIGILFVFAVGAILTANRNKSDLEEGVQEVNIVQEEKKQNDVPYIPPTVILEPDEIKIENQLVGEEAFRQSVISVLANPIKITNISLSYNVNNLNLDGADCTARTKILPNSSCTLNLSWTPNKKENRNLFIVINYDEYDGDKVHSNNLSKRIGVILQSKEPEKVVVQEEPAPVKKESFIKKESPAPEPDEEEEEEEDEDDYEISADLAPIAKEKTEIKPKRVIKPDDCKKYASKAYDFSGTFIGWVQGNNDVYAPNCSHIIGNMEDDGMVVESGTGRVIGKGVAVDKKKSEERRIELVLPLLDETIQAVSGPVQPDFSEVMENRRGVKNGDFGDRKTTIGDDEDIYQLRDTLGIYKAQQKRLIPFSINDQKQISSMPKDERYVLRQSKPIPAVLNRAVYFSSEVSNNQNVTATVERNVFGGDGRTIIIPSGSQLIGVAEYPGSVGLQAVQKINIKWNRLIRPDGAEFDLSNISNYSSDAQGRAGVPGKNDTEYMKQLFVKPLLYSALPIAMEAIFPSTSKIVTRVKRSDGTYNTIDNTINADDEETGSDYGFAWDNTQTVAEMTSKDKMKAEFQQNFKSVMQKLIEDSVKQQIPFTVPAGTRIQVFLNQDIMLRVNEEMDELLEESNKESSFEGGEAVGYEAESFTSESKAGATTISGSGFSAKSDNVTAREEEDYEE